MSKYRDVEKYWGRPGYWGQPGYCGWVRVSLGLFGVIWGSSREHPEGIQSHQGASGKRSKATWGFPRSSFCIFFKHLKNGCPKT